MEREDFIAFLNALEGFKPKFREFHWIDETNTMAAHKLCDMLMDMIVEFEDEFGESGFPIFGKLKFGEFFSSPDFSRTLEEAIQSLLTTVTNAGILANQEPNQCGLKALCDDFINKVNKTLFLETFK